MRIQLIDEQGVLWTDHHVGVHIDPEHGHCDLCENRTPVLFDVTIYPSDDDFPILRCHGCVGDGTPGERLVGVATACVPGSHDIYIIDPHRYMRLQPDQAHTLVQELAHHLTLAPPPRTRPQPRPVWPELARLAEHHRQGTALTAQPPVPPTADPPPPAGSQPSPDPG